MSSAQTNESTNQNFQWDKLINTIYPLISTVIGVIIGGLITYVITLKKIENQIRISYISTILGHQNIIEKFSKLLEKLEKIERADKPQLEKHLIHQINIEIKETWFYLLFTPSQKRCQELKDQIENEQWRETRKTIAEFLKGQW